MMESQGRNVKQKPGDEAESVNMEEHCLQIYFWAHICPGPLDGGQQHLQWSGPSYINYQL